MQTPTPPTKPIPPTPPSMKPTSSGTTATDTSTPITTATPSIGPSKTNTTNNIESHPDTKAPTTEASVAAPTGVPPLANSTTYKDTATETVVPSQTPISTNKPVMNFGLLFSLILIGSALFAAAHWWKKSKVKQNHRIDYSSESSDELVKLILSQENPQPKVSQTIAKKEPTKKAKSNFDFKV